MNLTPFTIKTELDIFHSSPGQNGVRLEHRVEFNATRNTA